MEFFDTLIKKALWQACMPVKHFLPCFICLLHCSHYLQQGLPCGGCSLLKSQRLISSLLTQAFLLQRPDWQTRPTDPLRTWLHPKGSTTLAWRD